MASQFTLTPEKKREEMKRRLGEAKSRTTKLEKRTDLDRPRRDIDWEDIARSVPPGLRSGLESTLGGLGDISGLQQSLASYGAGKLGFDPFTAASVAKYTSPFSLFPNTEQVSAKSDELFGRDAVTRYQPTTPQGQNTAGAANLATGLIGGPENFAKDVALNLGMGGITAAKLFRQGFGKIGEEVADAGTRTMFHGVQPKVKLDRPLEEMTATYEKTHDLKPDKPITYEDLHGGVVLPMPGDRTLTGYKLTGLNGQQFENPVNLQGGFRFSQGPHQQEQGLGWASNPSQMSRMSNDVRNAATANPGKDIFGVYLPMGGTSGDFSMMQYNAMMEMLRKQPPTAANAAAIDELVRSNPGIKNFPGIMPLIEGEGDDFAKIGGQRATLAKELAKGRASKLGIPQMGAARWAISEPELLNTPNFAGGQTVVRFNPEGRLVRGMEGHETYPVGIEAEQLGRLPETGYEDLFSTWNAGVDPAVKASNKEGKFRLELPAQQANEEWLKNLFRRGSG